MAESIRAFENSLREYLINMLVDAHNTPQQLSYKFNNLKVFIDPKRESKPHFYVSAGISEVCFDIDNVEKISGNFGPDERYITRWASKPNINGELKKTWMILAKTASSFYGKAANEELEEKLKIAEAENQKVDMLGIGVKSRFKGFEKFERRHRRH